MTPHHPYKPDKIHIKCSKDKIIAFSRTYKGETIIVLANLDHKNVQKKCVVKVPGIKKKGNLKLIHGETNYKTKSNKILTDLNPSEIKVLRLYNFSL